MSKSKESSIKGWKAITPTRTVVIYATTIEKAAEGFMEKFGYWPDYNLLEPILAHDKD